MKQKPPPTGPDAEDASGGTVELVWPGKRVGRGQPPGRPGGTACAVVERVSGGESVSDQWTNKLVLGDNLQLMDTLMEICAGQVDLIYLDPPFATGGRFCYAPRVPGGGNVKRTAYLDSWGRGGMGTYLNMMFPRLEAMRELLSPVGSLLVHVDWRASSHLRLVLDEIFGPAALVNEIVWCYGGGGAPRRYYPRKHDTILWYARSEQWIFHRQYRPYTEGTRQRGLTQVKGPRYQLRSEGAGLDDWWHGKETQKILSPTAYENLKYPTQKPEGLLRRILEGHSDPDSLVADFFCGSGTTLAVAEKLGRRWIGCDQGTSALQVARKRLLCMAERVRPFEVLAQVQDHPAQEQDQPAQVQDQPCDSDHDHGDEQERGAGRVALRVERGEGGVSVVLEGYTPVDPELEGVGTWTEGVDSWGVDWEHRGETFNLDWVSCNCREDPGVQLSSPPHRYAEPGDHDLAVKVVDVLGDEVVRIIQVTVGDDPITADDLEE